MAILYEGNLFRFAFDESMGDKTGFPYHALDMIKHVELRVCVRWIRSPVIIWNILKTLRYLVKRGCFLRTIKLVFDFVGALRGDVQSLLSVVHRDTTKIGAILSARFGSRTP